MTAQTVLTRLNVAATETQLSKNNATWAPVTHATQNGPHGLPVIHAVAFQLATDSASATKSIVNLRQLKCKIVPVRNASPLRGLFGHRALPLVANVLP